MKSARRLALAVLDGRAFGLFALVVVLGVAARLSLSLGAFVCVDAGLRVQAELAGAIALASAAWTLGRVPLVTRVRLALFRRLSAGLFAKPTFQAPRDGDADLVTAAFAGEAVLAHALPSLVSDGLSALVLTPLVASWVSGRTLVAAAAALIVTAILAQITRRFAERAGDRAWAAMHPLSSALAAARSDAPSLLANGRAAPALAELETRLLAFVRESRASDLVAGLSGRLPLVVAAVGVFFVAALLGEGEAALREGLVVASLLPPFAGVAQALSDLARTRASLEALPLDEPAISRWPVLPRGRLPATSIELAYPGGGGHVSVDGLALEEGSVTALVGDNGAGKSTVLRALAGLLPSPLELGDTRTVAYLPQSTALVGRTVKDHVRAWASGAHADRALAKITSAGLSPEAGVETLSAGQARRVALACVLADEAPLVLLDEPEQNLDARAQAWLVDELRALRSEGRRVVIASHASDLVELADERVTPRSTTI